MVVVRLSSGRMVDLDGVAAALRGECKQSHEQCLTQWGWTPEEAREIIAELKRRGLI